MPLLFPDLPHPGTEPASPALVDRFFTTELPGKTTHIFIVALTGKEFTCNAGDPGSIPGMGRSAGEGIGYPLQYSWASLVVCNVGDPGLIPGFGRSLGEGNSYPLQYSGLENSMDRGAWKFTVHEVKKAWILLSNHFHIVHNCQKLEAIIFFSRKMDKLWSIQTVEYYSVLKRRRAC